MTLACLDVSSNKSCVYRLFTYQLKAHTISNKLVSKVFAQKKGEKSYDSSNMCSNFGGIRLISKVSAQKKGKNSYGSYKCVQISVVSHVVPP